MADTIKRLTDEGNGIKVLQRIPLPSTSGYLCRDSAGNYLAIKDNRSGTVDPTANDDAALGYAIGSMWINTIKEASFTCVNSVIGQAVWLEQPKEQAGVDIYVGGYTYSSSWQIMTYLIFGGTNNVGTPTIAQVVAQVDNGGSGLIRLFDSTNSIEIAISPSITNTSYDITTLGSFSNLPTSTAMLEIQAKSTSNNKYINVNYVSMRF